MFIMTGSVVFLAISFLLFTRSIVEKSQEEELKKAEGRIFEKMEQYDHDDSVTPKFGGPLGSNLEIPYYLTYIVYDSDSYTLLATNDPFLPFLPNTNKKARHYFQKDYFFDGDLDILYYAEPHTNNKNHNIIIAVVLNIDNNQASALFASLPRAILSMAIPILFISFMLALFLTKKTIKPVAKITKAAQSVTIENLSDLLPMTGYDDEIDELSKTFNSLFLRLKQDFERERQFSSDVSHELNTPLTVISGQTNLLLRWGKKDPKQLETSLNAIKTEAKTMQAIIANLLQISRVESGRIKPQISEVVIGGLFSWLAEEFKAVAPDAKINFDITDITLRTDSEMLHQILTVIISNSIKYAGENCSIHLHAEKRDGLVLIEQSDDGPGFTEESLPHIFQRFYRADESHSRKIAGSGLGLAIALTLCNALGAKIKARNMIPHGAGFTIEFPDD